MKMNMKLPSVSGTTGVDVYGGVTLVVSVFITCLITMHVSMPIFFYPTIRAA